MRKTIDLFLVDYTQILKKKQNKNLQHRFLLEKNSNKRCKKYFINSDPYFVAGGNYVQMYLCHSFLGQTVSPLAIVLHIVDNVSKFITHIKNLVRFTRFSFLWFNLFRFGQWSQNLSVVDILLPAQCYVGCV